MLHARSTLVLLHSRSTLVLLSRSTLVLLLDAACDVLSFIHVAQVLLGCVSFNLPSCASFQCC